MVSPRASQPPQGCDERREIMSDDLPEDVEIHPVVSMDQTVSLCHDVRPGKIRIEGTVLRCHPAGGFAPDFKQPYERQTELPIGVEVAPRSTLRHNDGFAAMIKHVP